MAKSGWSWEKEGYVTPKSTDEAIEIKKKRQQEFEQNINNSLDNFNVNKALEKSPVPFKMPSFGTQTNSVDSSYTSSNDTDSQVTMPDFGINYGDNSDNVKMVQNLLENAGYSTGGVDGIYGDMTLNAIKKFQADSGLDVDGIVGPITSSKLLNIPDAPSTNIQDINAGYNFNSVPTLDNLGIKAPVSTAPTSSNYNFTKVPNLADLGIETTAKNTISMPNLSEMSFSDSNHPDISKLDFRTPSTSDNIQTQNTQNIQAETENNNGGWLDTLKGLFNTDSGSKALIQNIGKLAEPYTPEEQQKAIQDDPYILSMLQKGRTEANQGLMKAGELAAYELGKIPETIKKNGFGVNYDQHKDKNGTMPWVSKAVNSYESGMNNVENQFANASENLYQGSQMIDEAKNKDASFGKKLVGDIVSSTANMADVFIPGIGQTKFAIQAGGGYAKEAEKDGANKDKQLLYGAIGGAGEILLEQPVLKGLNKMFGGAFTDDLIKAGTNNMRKELGKLGVDMLKVMGKEAAEEIAIDPITGLAKKVIYKPNMNWFGEGGVIDPKQMAYDGLMGALTGGVLGLPSVPGNVINIKRTKDYIDSNYETTLVTAYGLPEDTESYRLAKQYSTFTQPVDFNTLVEFQKQVMRDTATVTLNAMEEQGVDVSGIQDINTIVDEIEVEANAYVDSVDIKNSQEFTSDNLLQTQLNNQEEIPTFIPGTTQHQQNIPVTSQEVNTPTLNNSEGNFTPVVNDGQNEVINSTQQVEVQPDETKSAADKFNIASVYHGTNKDFKEFDKSQNKRSTLYGGAFYFTDSLESAKEYATTYRGNSENSRVINASLSANKLWDYNNDKITPEQFEEIFNYAGDYEPITKPMTLGKIKGINEIAYAIEQLGYDGFKILEKDGSTTYAVFNPEQIKQLDKQALPIQQKAPQTPTTVQTNETTNNVTQPKVPTTETNTKSQANYKVGGTVTMKDSKGNTSEVEVIKIGDNSVTVQKAGGKPYSIGKSYFDKIISYGGVQSQQERKPKTKTPKYDGEVFYKGKSIGKMTVADAEAYTTLLESTGGDAQRVLNEYTYFSPELKQALEKVAEIQRNEKNHNDPGADSTIEVENNIPSSKIADKVVELLENDEPFTFAELTKIADEAYGGTQGQNTYTSKDAYDSMELGINKYILKHLSNIIKANADVAKKNVKALRELIGLIPTQTKGNTEQQQYQQFSTPPNIAYVAAWIANINQNDIMLEPSAGIGGLAVFAKAAKAKVIVNELSTRRLNILKNMPFDEFYNENAEHINDILNSKVSPTVVVMNPPFSSTAGRMADKNNTVNAKLHIEQALEILQDNGRLVAIVGQGMHDKAPAFMEWWNDIKRRYNVRANIGIYVPNETSSIQHSSEYKKYGTDFGVQLVVIDKTGTTPKTDKGYVTITGAKPKLEDIIDMLEGIKNDRTTIKIDGKDKQTPGIDSVQEGIGEKEGIANNEQPTYSTTDTVGDRTGDGKRGETRSSAKTTGQSGSDGTRKGNTTNGVNSERNGIEKNDGESRENSGLSPIDNAGAINGNESSVETIETESISKENQVNKVNEDAVYSEYEPQKIKIVGAKGHASPLVQSTAMASVPPPDVDYSPKIPKDIITTGTLSIAQMESIIYAGQQHTKKNPDDTRKAFFIGDGTGVGKGRQIAGIILDNWNQGRKKAVWVSKNGSLFTDAVRDWAALGGNEKDVFEASANKAIVNKTGILFTTYYTVPQGQKPNKKTGKIAELNRIDQIVQWLGKDYDGVLIFDESHMMQNSLGIKPAEMAVAGIKLQESLPNARIVYASATGATEVENLAYAPRLGLWGKGTSFSDVNDFVGKIKAGGLAAMELVARDMKAMGLYIARNISFIGVKYDTKVHNLTDIQAEIYDTMADGWQVVLQNINEYMKATGQDKNSKARKYITQNFWSTQQRFFNQVLTSMQMPTVIEDMKQRLAKGEACVLQLVNTNAAAEEREVSRIQEEGGSLDDMDITPKGALLEMIDKCFPTQLYEEFINDKGTKDTRPVVDSQGKPVESPAAVRAKEALMKNIDQMQVPNSPMDMVLQEFGVENVTEVTGRNRRFVFKKDKFGERTRQEESRTDKVVEADVNDFLNDKKQILIFSDAGGTGKSYHAGKTFKNQRHRVHYLIQAGWNASKAVQGFGRTHRTNQVSSPEYILVTTNLKGQKRFISSIARRLDQLGALTKGQRQTGSSGLFSAKDNLESKEAKDALELFYRQLVENKIPGLEAEPLLKRMGIYEKVIVKDSITTEVETLRDVTRFLNRILVLKSNEQNNVFDEFMRRVDYIVEEAIKNDNLDVGLENYKSAGATVTEEKVIHTDTTGAETKYIAITAKQTAYFWKYRELVDNEDFKGIYKNKETGEIKAALRAVDKTNSDGSITKMYYMQSPTYGKRSNIVEKSFVEKWEKVGKGEEKSLWEKETKNEPKFREEKLHLISGALLPVWDRLPKDHARVIRISADGGNSYLGRLVPTHQIDETLRTLGISRNKETFNVAESVKKVLENGMLIRLVNGTVVKRAKVAGEYRLEIDGDNIWSLERNYKGIFSEKIGSSWRWFLPTNAEGTKILEQIAESAPILEVVHNKSEESDIKAFTGKSQTYMPKGDDTSTLSKSVDDLIAIIEKHTGIPIRTGKFKQRALGIFKVKPEVIRTKVKNDMPVISHELGHALDKEFKFSDKGIFDNELLKLGQVTSKSSYSKKDIRQEGVAEFLRTYLTDPDKINSLAPGFLAHFEQTIDRDTLKFLSELRTGITAIRNLPNNKKIYNDVSDYETRKSTSKDVNLIQKFYDAWINSRGPFARLQKYAEEHGWKGKNIDILTQNHAGFEAKANSMLYDKQRDLEGNEIGDSLMDILKPLSHKEVKKRKGNVLQERKDFISYMIARRAIDYKDRKLVMPEPWYVYEDNIQKMEQQYSHFIDVFDSLREWENNNLQLLVDSGIMKKEQIEQIELMNANHVPLYRIQEAVENHRAGSGNTLGQSKKVIKRAKGSGATIIDPLESIITDSFIIRRAAESNSILGEIAHIAETIEGAGEVIEEISKSMKSTQFTVEEIQKQLNKIAEANNDTSLQDALKNIQDVELESMLSVFRPLNIEKENEITIYRNGTGKLYQVENELYRAIKGLNKQQSHFIIRALNVPKRILQTGAVTTVDFMLRNMMRDTITSSIQTEAGINPINIFMGYKSAILKDKWFKEWIASGGGSEFLNVSERSQAQKIEDDIFGLTFNDKMKQLGDAISEVKSNNNERTRAKVTNIAKSVFMIPFDTIRDGVQWSEAGPRIAELRKAIESGESKEVAAAWSRKLSQDFLRSGYYGKEYNKVAAFFNANIQGVVRMGETFKEHPLRTTLKGMAYITLPTLILYFINHDDDDYQQLPEWRKATFWNIPIGNGRFIPIPKPYGWGFIFGSIPEITLDRIYKDDPNTWDRIKAAFNQNFSIPVTPSAASPAVQVYANKSWTGAPIESISDKNLPSYLRAGSKTSGISRSIGSVLENEKGLSPKQLDYLVKGYMGKVGEYFWRLPDSLKSGVQTPTDITEYPVIKSFIVDSAYSSEAINKLYDYGTELASRKNELKQTGKYNAMGNTSIENQKELFEKGLEPARTEYNKIANDFSDARKAIKQIEESDKYSATVKKLKAREIQIKMNKMASDYNSKYEVFKKKYNIK